MTYTFELQCPRCKNETLMQFEDRDVPGPLHCAECLMDDMTIVRVDVIETKGATICTRT